MKSLQDASRDQLNSVVESVNTISNKTNIITDIVFQTKLLSFNASVEAARAGEHGKGFSVVAEEIGNLATNSGDASQDINEIVSKSKDELSSSVESITKNLASFQSDLETAFETWKEISNTLSDSFVSVEKNSKEQENFLKDISSAAQEQDIGVKDLNDSLFVIQDSSNRSLEKIKKLEAVVSNLDKESKNLTFLNKKISS